MTKEIKQILKALKQRPSATNYQIANSENQLGVKLPAEYVQFLKLTNGGEGFIGSAYVQLWGVDELVSMNEAYEVQTCVPGALLFGSDGGGEAYGFDTQSPGWLIVKIPFIELDWNEAESIAQTFDGFLQYISEAEF